MSTESDPTSPLKLQKESIPAYPWDDLMALLPQDVIDVAVEALNSGDVSFGDAEYTVFAGEYAFELIDDSFAQREMSEDDKHLVVALREVLVDTNALVYVRG
jgi:hypothetical protein